MRSSSSLIVIALVSTGAACTTPAPPRVPVGTTETTCAAFAPQPSPFRQGAPSKAAVGFAISASCAGPADPEDVAAVVRAIVDTQLLESRLAAERARSARVREVAARAAHDFGKANETLKAIGDLEPFEVEDTDASQSLRAASGTALQRLRSANADDFDRQYVSGAIAARTPLIEMLDQMACQADPLLRRGLAELRSTLADARRDAQDAAAELSREP
jgi:predicted outer membrane protein